jgi:hypothetical protein
MISDKAKKAVFAGPLSLRLFYVKADIGEKSLNLFLGKYFNIMYSSCIW